MKDCIELPVADIGNDSRMSIHIERTVCGTDGLDGSGVGSSTLPLRKKVRAAIRGAVAAEVNNDVISFLNEGVLVKTMERFNDICARGKGRVG